MNNEAKKYYKELMSQVIQEGRHMAEQTAIASIAQRTNTYAETLPWIRRSNRIRETMRGLIRITKRNRSLSLTRSA